MRKESVVLLEILGVLEENFIKNTTVCKLLGMETDGPLLQIDQYIFRGKYTDSLGTMVLFEEVKDGSGDGKPKLKFSCTSDKILQMRREFVQVNDRKESVSSQEVDSDSKKMDTQE